MSHFFFEQTANTLLPLPCSISPLGLAFGYSSAATFQVFLTVEWLTIFGSCINVGGLFGSLLSGYLLSTRGRRWTLLFSCTVGALGWFGIYYSAATVYARYSPSILFILGRVVTGFSAGMLIPAGSAYLIEIAPPSFQGLYGLLTQIGIVSGIAGSYVLGAWLRWEVVALVDAIGLCVIMLAIVLIPESPKWLAKKNLITLATDSSVLLYGTVSPLLS